MYCVILLYLSKLQQCLTTNIQYTPYNMYMLLFCFTEVILLVLVDSQGLYTHEYFSRLSQWHWGKRTSTKEVTLKDMGKIKSGHKFAQSHWNDEFHQNQWTKGANNHYLPLECDTWSQISQRKSTCRWLFIWAFSKEFPNVRKLQMVQDITWRVDMLTLWLTNMWFS